VDLLEKQSTQKYTDLTKYSFTLAVIPEYDSNYLYKYAQDNSHKRHISFNV